MVKRAWIIICRINAVLKIAMLLDSRELAMTLIPLYR